MIYRTAQMIYRNEIFDEKGESEYNYHKYHKNPSKPFENMNDQLNPKVVHRQDLDFLLQAY